MDVVEILKALGNDTRYRMVQLLLSDNYCVRALAVELNVSESAVSQHLKILREAGIVKARRKGHHIHYRVNRDVLKYAADELMKLADMGDCSSHHTNSCSRKSGKKPGGKKEVKRKS
ncbi:MAG TPA: metalloregulator ArsR/SmtB family transcription factor [Bacillota bacterium]|nr:metalloregulator ArsR/SmtB family transcription factor [Bacillota bacterium]HOL12285.1 metalloregulator ArsR/SmtB family transcription factor [Bacillota bacterium]HOQ03466.1 metalloregulator ArsR/SmtB family transcription factor [Bacillota bacterium]HPV14008.1 metalloregulator ArsR/SmtB family transcription factor [Bacillota bacterium]